MTTEWLIPAEQWGEHALVVLVTLAVTALVVAIHYEGLHWLARRYAVREPKRDRRAMLAIIFALLTLHVVEIWCYGFAYWGLLVVPDAGAIHGEQGFESLFDAVYLSATTYTTLGFGDLAPVGAIRFVSGMESLTGLLLITWSASFTYLEMSRLWTGTRDR
ncbi:MAG: potassium channel family protein [Pseudomonadota bacterium]